MDKNLTLLKMIIEDKKEKTNIFCTWFNFYWTLNVAALAFFKETIVRVELIILFIVLTVGAIGTSIGLHVFTQKKIETIKTLEVEIFQHESHPILFGPLEKWFVLIYTSSFFVLLIFWIVMFFMK